MDMMHTISIEEAQSIILKQVSALEPAVEEVNVLDALGRVIAKDLYSDIDVSPFAHSAMDGFAVLASDVEKASEGAPVYLKIAACIGAGDVFERALEPGECVRIMTGAATPDGEVGVVKIEDVTFAASLDCDGASVEGAGADEGAGATGVGAGEGEGAGATVAGEAKGEVGEYICVKAPVAVGKNIRAVGEEVHAGELAFKKGEIVKPAGVGLLASTGNLTVPVYARPKVGIIINGSELVPSEQVPGPGKIRDSNSWSIAAYVVEAGGIPVNYPIVEDDPDAIRAAYVKAFAECDCVVSTGGACLGDFDFSPKVIDELGELLFTRVSMRPGKSQPFGMVDGKPVFVLSGNPAASAVGFEMFARIALRAMQGYTDFDRPRVKARLAVDQKKHESRVFLQRGTVTRDEKWSEGTDMSAYVAAPFKKQSSGLNGELQNANALIVLPEGVRDWKAGEIVDCLLIAPL
jgi:molybdopterin molybdotransferase